MAKKKKRKKCNPKFTIVFKLRDISDDTDKYASIFMRMLETSGRNFSNIDFDGVFVYTNVTYSSKKVALQDALHLAKAVNDFLGRDLWSVSEV
jgi:hypothetical protein